MLFSSVLAATILTSRDAPRPHHESEFDYYSVTVVTWQEKSRCSSHRRSLSVYALAQSRLVAIYDSSRICTCAGYSPWLPLNNGFVYFWLCPSLGFILKWILQRFVLVGFSRRWFVRSIKFVRSLSSCLFFTNHSRTRILPVQSLPEKPNWGT